MGRNPNVQFSYLVDSPENAPMVIDWWRTIWADRMGDNIEHTVKQLQESLSKTELPIHVLAIVDGTPVGTAVLKKQEISEVFPDCQYWLGSVFVKEQSRGAHIATELSLHIVDLARRLGLPHLYLQTVDLDGGLYVNLGWRALQEFVYREEHTLLMLKKL
jgi:GNAT superfamily N-acetyltransferase